MNREKLLQSIGDHEGFRALPYKDTEGLWTWLKGRCLETNPLSGAEWKELLDAGVIEVKGTVAAADRLVGSQIDRSVRVLSTAFRGWLSFSDVRQNVIIEMTYQIKGFPGSFPRFCAAAEAGDWVDAAAEGLDSKWAREDSPARARELMRMLETDSWPSK